MKYRVRWSMEGTSYVEADTPQEAEYAMEDKTPEELNQDSLSLEIYDVEEWKE